MSVFSPELDIHILTDPAELDAAAELITAQMMFNPEVNAQLNRSRRPRPITLPTPTAAEVDYEKKLISELDELQFGAFDEQGKIISVAGLARKSNLEPGGRGQVVDVVTRWGYRRMGIGRTVMGALEEHARKQGLSELRIFGSTRKGGYLYDHLGYDWDEKLRGYTKPL